MKDALAVLAALIVVGGYVPYFRDAFTKRVKPHPYTWLIWTIVSGITFFGQLEKGAGIGALPTGFSLFFSFCVFVFSLQYGFKYIIRSDTYFFVAALFALVPWIITDDPTLSVVIAVSIDVIAFIPTIRKTWQKPKTETPILYGANVLKHILTLGALQSYNVATMLHSIAMIITNGIMTAIILFKKTPATAKKTPGPVSPIVPK